jgi:hypothetical protein
VRASLQDECAAAATPLGYTRRARRCSTGAPGHALGWLECGFGAVTTGQNLVVDNNPVDVAELV